MKKFDDKSVYFIIILCLLFLIPAPCSAQNRRATTPSSIRHNPDMEKMVTRKSSLAREREVLHAKRLSEGRYFLNNSDGSFCYLGEIRSESSVYPHGKGLGMLRVRDGESGVVSNEFVLCSWKRGSRHGKGVIKHPDGRYEHAVWKWNKMTIVPDSPVSPEEQAVMEDQIKQIEIAYKRFFFLP